MAKRKSKKVGLNQVLVLNKYILHLFGVESLEALSDGMRSSQHEGYGNDNTSKFYHFLVSNLFTNQDLDKDILLGYDQNIFRYTQSISESRTQPIRWKYFQYLSILFTEIYLDRYFQDKNGLLLSLNEFVDRFNDPYYQFAKFYNPTGFVVEKFELSDLHKLAFWNATGSGKTLVMHVNIEQYMHYLSKYRQGATLNRVILITPNEGLSNQHLEEFKLSNISASLFSKERSGSIGLGNLFAGKSVEILSIHKLEDKEGPDTVAVDSFEENNLVLIDEGHRGSSGTEWKRKRDQLSTQGFSFEYSATFGQAVAAASSKDSLMTEYSKSTLFDYSYKYFHRDGYGKDFEILNLEDTSREEALHKYLVACLLSFYQQLLVFEENKKQVKPFLVEKPLCIFVGGSVTKSLSSKEATDIQKIINFISRFVKEKRESVEILEQLIGGLDGLEDKNKRLVFANKFEYLYGKQFTGIDLYRNMLKLIFNSTVEEGQLHLLNLKGQTGEIGLRVGQGDYFGVINVSDDSKLIKQCQKAGISTNSDEFSKSVFNGLNKDDSTANILIGAKKFTEGWSSWRVSMMGLMNIGRSEGSQIIQLFGRGVRLRGHNFSLKRSNRLDIYEKPDNIPSCLPIMETLNVFGIKSDYMALFKQFLEEDGIATEKKEQIEIATTILPIIELDKKKLKLVRVQEGRDFKKERSPLTLLSSKTNTSKIVLDWYPKIAVTKSKQAKQVLLEGESEQGKLEAKHTAFFDWEMIYFELQKFKNERSWYNVSFSKQGLIDLIKDKSWYTLYIPKSELLLTSFEKVFIWQDIAITLFKSYFDRTYNYLKQEYISQYLETFTLDKTHPNLKDAEKYIFHIERSRTDIIEKLKEIKSAFETDALSKEMNFGRLSNVFPFERHLYQPLIWFTQKEYKDIVNVKPLQLNSGEKDFVMDLKNFYEKKPSFFDNKEIFLLRNMSKKGVGFFEANNFYPDFILWILQGDMQYVTFVDPKGLRQVDGFEDPKVEFYTNIKSKIQAKLEDDKIVLNSFIVSATEFQKVPWRGKKDIDAFNEHHVLFQHEQKDEYIDMILNKSIS